MLGTWKASPRYRADPQLSCSIKSCFTPKNPRIVWVQALSPPSPTLPQHCPVPKCHMHRALKSLQGQDWTPGLDIPLGKKCSLKSTFSLCLGTPGVTFSHSSSTPRSLSKSRSLTLPKPFMAFKDVLYPVLRNNTAPSGRRDQILNYVNSKEYYKGCVYLIWKGTLESTTTCTAFPTATPFEVPKKKIHLLSREPEVPGCMD